MKLKNKKIKLVCFLLLLLLGSLFLTGCNNPFSSNDDEVVWDTYTNNEFGIQYPSEWEVSEEGNDIYIKPSKDSNFKLVVGGPFDETKEELKEEFEEYTLYEFNKLETVNIIDWQGNEANNYKKQINNHFAYSFEFKGVLEEFHSDWEGFDKGKLFLIHNRDDDLTFDVFYIGSEKEYDKNADIAEKMVNSFEFLLSTNSIKSLNNR